MKRSLLAACLCAAALALGAGCAAPNPGEYLAQEARLSATPAGAAAVVATLATNKCEEAAAPHQTRAIVGVRHATRQFQAGRLDAARFRQVIEAGREAREALAKACEGRRDDIDQAQLERGAAAVERIRKTLGG